MHKLIWNKIKQWFTGIEYIQTEAPTIVFKQGDYLKFKQGWFLILVVISNNQCTSQLVCLLPTGQIEIIMVVNLKEAYYSFGNGFYGLNHTWI